MKKSRSEELEEVILESRIKVKPVYGPEDIKSISYEREIGQPGF